VFYNPGQQSPSLDRYVEIEKALADRGYLRKDADGKWDQRSADALKQFQQDQNLRADGKLSSMSLIALGLGPKRTPGAAVPPRFGPVPTPVPVQPHGGGDPTK
jgi:peptidoglycan hydrolase-like protein with peptidoglycan-binding domain